MKKGKKVGLVLGKFMPLHRGHEVLIHFASRYVDRLFVVVDNVPEDRYVTGYIPGHIRVAWVQRTCPTAEVFYLPHVNPQEPSEHRQFWQIWKKSLLDLLPEKPDVVFASEEYGFPLARVLGSTFIPLDIHRKTIHMSATKLRTELYTHWDYLSQVAKSDFTMRICICGPESSGKSTLTQKLAEHFNTVFVPEYARSYLETYIKKSEQEKKKYKISLRDMVPIARGQCALEDTLTQYANRLIFSDTDAWTTMRWSKWLFNGACDREVLRLAEHQKHDLYLLVKPDIGWEKDEIRYTPNVKARMKFFSEYEKMLKEYKYPFAVIDGVGVKRTKKAIRAVENIIRERFTYQYFVERLR
ncbi:MAG: AAA family ATPase [bacterium]|nr:AAA family ATPase [bacterium]